MSVTRIINVDNEPELPAYHGNSTNFYAVGISPSAETVQVSSPKEEAEAKKFFREYFSRMVSDIHWQAYERQMNPPLWIKSGLPVKTSVTVDDKLDWIMDWLDERAGVVRPESDQPENYYVRTKPNSKNTGVIHGHSANAGDVLRAAQGWDAYVSKMFGLLNVLELGIGDLGDREVFVLPIFFGLDIPETISDIILEEDRVIYKQDYPDEEPIEYQIGLLKSFPEADQIGPVNSQSGFINQDADDEVNRLLKIIESSAASSLWTTPVLLNIFSKDGISDVFKDDLQIFSKGSLVEGEFGSFNEVIETKIKLDESVNGITPQQKSFSLLFNKDIAVDLEISLINQNGDDVSLNCIKHYLMTIDAEMPLYDMAFNKIEAIWVEEKKHHRITLQLDVLARQYVISSGYILVHELLTSKGSLDTVLLSDSSGTPIDPVDGVYKIGIDINEEEDIEFFIKDVSGESPILYLKDIQVKVNDFTTSNKINLKIQNSDHEDPPCVISSYFSGYTSNLGELQNFHISWDTATPEDALELKIVIKSNQKTRILERAQKDINNVEWIARAGVVTLLDPVMYSLLMPGPSRSEGKIIYLLIDLILGRLKSSGSILLESITDEQLYDHIHDSISSISICRPRDAHRFQINEELRLFLDLDQSEHDDIKGLIKYLAKENELRDINYEELVFDTELNSVIRALTELTVYLEQESGVEAIIIRVLTRLFEPTVQDEETVQPSLYKKLKGSDNGENLKLKKALDEAWLNFKGLFQDSVNGSDLVRGSVGTVFLDSLVGSVFRLYYPNIRNFLLPQLPSESFTWSRLRVDLYEYYEEQSWARLAQLLWRPRYEDNNLKKQLQRELDEAYRHIIQEMLPAEEDTPSKLLSLMPPDSSPQPLSFQIAGDLDPKEMTGFDHVFKGVGVLLKRVIHNQHDTAWAHANLVELNHEPDTSVLVAISLDASSWAKTLPAKNEKNIAVCRSSTEEPLFFATNSSVLTTALALTTTGDQIQVLSAGSDHKLRLGTNLDPEIIFEPDEKPAHSNRITSLAINHNNKTAYSAGWDGTIVAWDMDNHKKIKVISDVGSKLNKIAISPDGNMLIGGTWDMRLLLWNLQEIRNAGNQNQNIIDPEVIERKENTLVTSVAISEKLVAWGDKEGNVFISYTSKISDTVSQVKDHEDWVSSICLDKHGKTLVTAGGDGRLIHYELDLTHNDKPNYRIVRNIKIDTAITCLRMDDVGIHIAISTRNGWANKVGINEIVNIDPDEEIVVNPFYGTQPIVRPLAPALMDNRRALFIEYHGNPLNTPAFVSSRTRQVQFKDADILMRKEFILADDVDYANLPDDFQVTPELVYGATYYVPAFVVTHGGTLPPALQEQGNRGLPSPEILDQDGEVYRNSKRYDYMRRTAFGQISFKGNPEFQSEAEKHVLKSIFPISDDYPRQSLGSKSNQVAYLDLFRNTDGQGGILFSGREEVDVALRDFTWLGGVGKFKIELMTMKIEGRPRPYPAGVAFTEQPENTYFEFLKEIRFTEGIEIRINRKKMQITFPGKEESFQFQEYLKDVPYWIRLTIEPKRDLDNSVAISFEDTLSAEDPGNFIARPERANRIMLAQEKNVWLSAMSSTKSFEMKLPRVGFIDFKRWTGNSNLPNPYPDSYNGVQNPKIIIDDLLLDAYVMRAELGAEAAELLERLPDPAVQMLKIDLIVEDSLTTFIGDAFQSEVIDVDSQFKMPKPRTPPDLTDPQFDENYSKFLTDYLNEMEEAFASEINVNIANDVKLKIENNKVLVNLPPGVVARLKIRPITLQSNCEGPGAAFDPGITARHIGEFYLGKYYFVFPGQDLIIETLIDYLNINSEEKEKNVRNQLLPELLKVVPDGSDRRYQLALSGSLKELGTDQERETWKNFSHIKTISQQWRFSGRPLYSWPELYEIRKAVQSENPSPVIHVSGKTIGKDLFKDFKRFEMEAFFDRDDMDAGDSVFRLPPIPSTANDDEPVSSMLQEFIWNSSSATMYRHRFTLISRYAAAMDPNGGGVKSINSWVKDKIAVKRKQLDKDYWFYRTVMLAEQYRVEINRPKLRALIPLTSNPGKNDEHPPPVLAVLDEQPFLDGGLAERVLGIIHTGVHYGFPDTVESQGEEGEVTGNTEGKVVQPLDTRKEIGKNPRMTLRAFDEETALGVSLRHEGPIGLTFDQGSASTPAWANSQHLFTPALLHNEEQRIPGELQLGVSLIRMFDPEWCFNSDPTIQVNENEANLPSAKNWMIKLSLGNEKDEESPPDILNISGTPILSLFTFRNTSYEQVKIWNRVLDSYAEETKWSPLFVYNPSANVEFYMVHVVLNEFSFRTIFLQKTRADSGTTSDASEGIENGYHVMCSVDWSLPDDEKTELEDDFELTVNLVDGSFDPQPISISSPTELQWAKTVGDNTKLFINRREHEHETRLISVENLELKHAMKQDSGVVRVYQKNKEPDASEVLWVRGEIAQANVPNATHRYVAMMFTKLAAGIGSQTEIFAGATVISGNETKLAQEIQTKIAENPDTEVNVRFVLFETPAQAVGSGSIRPEFGKAYFDLTAVSNQCKAVRIRVSFVKGCGAIAHKAKLILTPSNGVNNIEVPLDLAVDKKLDTVELLLDATKNHEEVELKVMDLDLIDVEGEKISENYEAPVALPEDSIVVKKDGLYLEIVSIEEVWADVSFLVHTNRGDNSSQELLMNVFDFNWAFSHDSNSSLATSLGKQKLAAMKETQALIQMISPPRKLIKQ